MSHIDTVAELFKESTDKYGDKIAAVEGERRITYSELRSVTNSLAAYLRIRGFGKRDKVGILLPNSIEFIAAVFAVSGIGSVSLLLNTASVEDELRYYLNHSRLQLLVTDSVRAEVAKKAAEGAGAEILIVKGDSADWRYGPDALTETPIGEMEEYILPEDEAVYLYSTGSTGKPKRVTRTHYNLASLVRNHVDTIGWTGEERIMFTIPMSHTYAFGNFLGAVKVGAEMHLVEGFRRSVILKTLERERITVFPAVPFMLGIMANSFLAEPPDLSSLKTVISAGAPLPEDVFVKFEEKFGVPPRQLYGSSETGVIAINTAKDVAERWNSVGRPAVNVTVKIIAEDGAEDGTEEVTECGVNEIGEITVKSPSMTTSYYEMPEETERAFRGGFYHTGDLGRIDEEGYIFIEGRKKLVINVAGNKVDPAHVEEVLVKHPSIKEAAVLGVQTDGGEAVKSVIVTEEGEELKPSEVIKFLHGKLSEYKIPRIIEFRDELPRSPTGKVLRERLK